MRTQSAILLFGLAGCSASLSGPRSDLSGNLRETASATIIASGSESGGRAVLTVIDLENVGGSTETVTWGVDCSGAGAVNLRVYRSAGGSQGLVWSSTALPRVLGCPTQLIKRTIDTAGHVQLQFTVPVETILGDSLPAGAYVLTATALTSPELPGEVPAGTLTLAKGIVAPPGTDLDGTWTGSANGLSLSLNLHWTADSVTGTGTYNASSSNTFGCGGGTLRGAGTVSYAAGRKQDQFQGGIKFSGGWFPPFGGVLADQRTIAGSFMSVDRGPCYLTLTRQ
ncbi:MAG TPA: hypothetical protein VFJ20_05490 [Gemmatimonadaceae bacterium]|nr:hypothetical protein [Gemmatimonadaceae bacterium]